MDPLSITLSVTALLKLTKDVVFYFKEARDASDERKKFVREISGLSGMLTTLIDFVNEEDPDDPWLLAVLELVGKDGPFDQFASALQQLKAKIAPTSGVRKLGQILLWKQIKEDVQILLSQIERLKTLVGVALEVDHIRLSLEIKSTVADMTAGIAELQVRSKVIEHNTTAILHEASARRKRELLDRICDVDYLQQHRDAIARHQHGTGNWFLDEEIYQTWAGSPRGTLVCPGVPGAGKTIMAALVIEQQLRAARVSMKPVVFIYYNYKRRDQQTLRHTLQTFLRQVVDTLPEAPKLLDEFTNPAYTPTTNELSSVLGKLLEDIKELTIITDALDECHDSTRGDILSYIAGLQSNISVRYLTTTRDFYPNVSHSIFENEPRIEIKASRYDLEVYTRSRAKTLRARLQPDLLDDVVDGVVTAADGMLVKIPHVLKDMRVGHSLVYRFLLAQLLMDSFQTRLKVKTIRADLLALPKGLDAYDTAYDDAMTRIFGQERDYQESAAKILSLILCARRPLKLAELQHASMIETEDTELDRENSLDSDTMLSICAGLITVDQSSDTIRFVHYTTQEYLQRTQERWFPKAEFKIARACLDYLLLHEFALAPKDTMEEPISGGSNPWLANLGNDTFKIYVTGAEFTTPDDNAKDMKRRKLEFPFAEYAIKHGPYHWDAVILTEMSMHADLLSLLMSSQILSTMRQMFHPHHYPDDSFPGTKLDVVVNWFSQLCLANLTKFCLVNGLACDTTAQSSGLSPLSYAAMHGHEPLVRLLLEYNANVESSNERNHTPLMEAAMRGHESIVQLLLRNGALVDRKDTEGSTALMHAANGGQELVVRALLAHNTDIESANVWGRTPLLEASIEGYESVAQLLIRHGAAVNVRDNSGMTPLSHAAENGHDNLLQIFLQHDISVDCRNLEGQTPLALAAMNWNEEATRILLEHGAQIDCADREGMTALSHAANRSSMAVLQCLLEHDTTVDFKSKSGRTPLSYAASRGSIGRTRLLLEHGAAVDAADDGDRTPLSFAACSFDEGAARLLIKYGASIDARDNNGRTPLMYACEHDSDGNVNLLLEQHAAVTARDNGARTPLSFAAECGSDKIIRTLFERGAAIDEEDNDGRTPLSYAAASLNGLSNATQFLLEKGAFVNSKDSDGCTPLWYAVHEYTNAAHVLVEHGAIIDAENCNGRTALSRAAEKGLESVVEMLFRKGADPNKSDAHGQTPLHHAVIWRATPVVSLLCSLSGVDVDPIDNSGRTPLWYAADKDRCYGDTESWMPFESIKNILLSTRRVDTLVLDDTSI